MNGQYVIEQLNKHAARFGSTFAERIEEALDTAMVHWHTDPKKDSWLDAVNAINNYFIIKVLSKYDDELGKDSRRLRNVFVCPGMAANLADWIADVSTTAFPVLARITDFGRN